MLKDILSVAKLTTKKITTFRYCSLLYEAKDRGFTKGENISGTVKF